MYHVLYVHTFLSSTMYCTYTFFFIVSMYSTCTLTGFWNIEQCKLIPQSLCERSLGYVCTNSVLVISADRIDFTDLHNNALNMTVRVPGFGSGPTVKCTKNSVIIALRKNNITKEDIDEDHDCDGGAGAGG